jgi:hypothetical protein
MIASFQNKYLAGIVVALFQIGGGPWMDNRPYYMQPWDEVLGPALEVEEHDGHCLALIGKISVLLPMEMSTRLEDAKGQRVGILRTDNDYRFRVIEEGIKGC